MSQSSVTAAAPPEAMVVANAVVEDDDDDSQMPADNASVLSGGGAGGEDDEQRRNYFVSLEKAQQRSQLELLIATKDPSVQIVKQDKQTKSDVWSNDQYRMIYRDGVRQNFALCTECQALITHKSCYGTGGLLRHRCFRKRNGLMQTHGRGRRTRKSGLMVGGGGGSFGSSSPSQRRRSSRQRLTTMTPRKARGASSGSSSCSTPEQDAGADEPAAMRQLPASASTAYNEDTLTQIRHELETLIQHSDASIALQKPPVGSRSLVWTYNLLQMVYRDGERQDFVHCVQCGQLLVHRVQAGTNRLMRHPCIQQAMERMQQHTLQQNAAAVAASAAAASHPQPIEDATTDAKHEFNEQQVDQTSPYDGRRRRSTIEEDDDDTPNTYISPFMRLPGDEEVGGGGATTSASDAATGIDADKRRIAKLQLQLMSSEFMPSALLDSGGGANSGLLPNNSYQRLLQCLLSSAVEFGRFDAHRSFLDAAGVQQRLAARRSALHDRLRHIVAVEKLAFSCDVWQHRPDVGGAGGGQQLVCCTMNGHYVDDAYRLRNVVLGTRVHRAEAGDLFELCVQMLRPYVADSRRTALRMLSNATIVVDGVRNRNGMQRMINCVASGLNGIATELIAGSTEAQQVCASVTAKLAQHASPEIRAMLQRFDATRWESIWNLLTVYREIVGTVECPHEIDDILAYLEPLREVSTCLGRFGAQTPTINLVYPFRQKLLDVFSTALDATTLAIKQMFLASFKANFVLTDLHRIAVFLDPRFKSLRFFAPDERERIVEMTKVLISDGTEQEQKQQQQAGQQQQPHAHLADYMDDGITVAPSPNEVDAYQRLQLSGTLRCADDDQVLAFWQQRDDLPRLQNLVRQILCIPASCTADGCHFSPEARRMLEHRARMEVSELDAGLMVVGNRDV